MVYKETMRKLFEGQQHLHLNESNEQEFQIPLGLGPDGAIEDEDMEDGGVRLEAEVPVISITAAEVGQRSLHDFFGGGLCEQKQMHSERPPTAPLAAAEMWSFGQQNLREDMMDFEAASDTKPEQVEVERGQQTMDWFLFGRR
jgi:hypothetical protein